ncbi:MAG: mechanosensitive ion channel [Myxococcales bacterium]|nr:mechanosensitive ion channel [Myxococcales bacterium]MCB9530887.1 mechanosensitive ion channel [Myxococcales bacterium]
MDVDYSALASLLRPERFLAALAIIGVAVFASKTVTRLLDGLGERQARRRLLYKRASSILRFVIFLAAAALVVTNVLTLSSEAMIALGGTMAVTIGFALKDTAASLISGILILMDQPFQVGDRIAFGGYYGEVQEIGLRSVRIVTLDDNLVSIPTNKFLTDVVASANAGALDMMVVVDFHIDPHADFDRAMALAREATLTSKYVFLNKPVVVLVGEAEIGEQLATRIRVKAYVVDARFESKFASDVTAKVKRAFRAAGIALPASAPGH